MPFVVVDGSGRQAGRANSTAMEVSYYGKTAQFRLSAAAVEAIGSPAKVEVQFDQENRQIAFVPSDAKHAVTLRSDSEDSKSRYFGFRSLAALVGLDAESRETIPLTLHADGYLLGNLPAADEQANAA